MQSTLTTMQYQHGQEIVPSAGLPYPSFSLHRFEKRDAVAICQEPYSLTVLRKEKDIRLWKLENACVDLSN